MEEEITLLQQKDKNFPGSFWLILWKNRSLIVEKAE